MAKGAKQEQPEDNLPWTQYLLFALLFLVLPGACVLVSSVMYYVWKEKHPQSANQINTLGFIIFGIQIILIILVPDLRSWLLSMA